MFDTAENIRVMVIVLLISVVLLLRYRDRRKDAAKREAREAGSGTPAGARPNLYAVAAEVAGVMGQASHVEDLRRNEKFQKGVALLLGPGFEVDALVAYACGENDAIACLASEALLEMKAGGDAPGKILAALPRIEGWPLRFALLYLEGVVPPSEALSSRVLARVRVDEWEKGSLRVLSEFLDRRAAAGEKASFGEDFDLLPLEARQRVETLLREIEGDRAKALVEELSRRMAGRIDREFLASVGLLWSESHYREADDVLDHGALSGTVAEMERLLLAEKPRSIVLVGESGVGKTALVKRLAERLHRKGWEIFEAGHTELVAGQMYYGQLEERLRKLIRQLGGNRRVLWHIPDFHALSDSGRHRYSDVSTLDMIVPHVEAGEIVVLGESLPAAFDRVARGVPRVVSAFETLRLQPASEAQAADLARMWIRARRGGDLAAQDEETIREAGHLAQQFLGFRALPGSLLELLSLSWKRISASDPQRPFELLPADLIATLSQLTGLPAQMLDDREELDLDSVRGFFARHVKGQHEAVDCLVERIAMIKAGVTDPSRPLGVFLFAGPTGTGKTEIAKALAECLFGSADRMIRLDMSEFQASESIHRLVGSADERGEGSLVDRIRRQPFAVILLDEFEKSHPRVWDLFLQVFDDGRLTDARGDTADFRHAIIILTSNLGGIVPSGVGLGFSREPEAFHPEAVQRTVAKAFRKEFLNRLDRVVVFRPLGREVMREILQKDLGDVLLRRGLRSRNWAVEFDPSALEFLLELGFTLDLGARPLKRAIERHLLAPLATTIVNHQIPDGDQFLFVTRQENALGVEFVDPDAPDEKAEDSRATLESEKPGLPDLRLEWLALNAKGTTEELAFLAERYRRIENVVESEGWRREKTMSISMTELPEFWISSERFDILGRYEYQDRIESGVQRAGSLLERLGRGGGRGRSHHPPHLLATLAQNLYLLGAACEDVEQNRPRDAFLVVEAGRDGVHADPDANHFAAALGGMYREWARKRRMSAMILADPASDRDEPYVFMIAVSGFGAYAILSREDGLHVFEAPAADARAFDRCRAQVRVFSRRGEPLGEDADSLRSELERVLASSVSGELRIVRRYRREPSPLVRDSVRGWRTGKLERVLGGDFDLIVDDSR